ncbi:DUF1489 domain-containing protein [Roseovarius sp. SCSIO 43702]|uniref:DUF1489 family protein n=1 Tax=Roseovarius sp. SCSIO 43702 TaxID=2823043 RepID=UPI001C732D03|nr:DUF1489 domain-containing protein [Roseovarius sp. SCSIO 43702]QYX58293.1 DUF1489 domain-containing protein [Roseovarius sp. SCSIO 43702]
MRYWTFARLRHKCKEGYDLRGWPVPQDFVNLIKLSVGTETVDDLIRWQTSRAAEREDGLPRHVTRMWPRRDAEVLAGGSIYWVIQGFVQCRQRILRLDEVTGQDGIRRCGIVLDPAITRTTAARKRPFQGWRYLDAADAPADLSGVGDGDDSLPPALSAALADIGVI